MDKQKLLLVDDDSDLLLSLSRGLKGVGFQGCVFAATTADQGAALLKSEKPQVAVIDLCIDERQGVESGFSLLRQILLEDETCRVIMLTGHGSIQNGVRAIRAGAANFLAKPVDPAHLLALVEDGIQQCAIRRAYETLSAEHSEMGLENLLIGSSEVMKKLRKELLYAGQNNQSVLMLGETGTGKSLCARAIHVFGRREEGPFVCFQPTVSGPDMAASELFGHRRGAFTGAIEDREGLLKHASEGTLFLDEVDMLPESIQVMLLRVLQDRKFRPIGSQREQISNVRFLSASNCEMEVALSKGKLRKDFYHRIAHRVIQIPPLRERLEDLPELVHAFLARLRVEEKVQVFSISPAALKALRQYAWPGNVRELCATVEGAAYSADFEGKGEISEEHIHLLSEGNRNGSGSFREQVEAYQIDLIRKALHEHQGNQMRAAEALRVDRSTMRRILARNEEISIGS